MADQGHVGGVVVGAQAHQIVMKHQIHDPMQTVLDAPTGAGGVEERGGE